MTRSVVLLSGGLDSATALAIARARGDECHTLSFDYGQRHRAELAAARRVVALFEAHPGAGALQLDGRMVDAPHLAAARRLLAVARAD